MSVNVLSFTDRFLTGGNTYWLHHFFIEIYLFNISLLEDTVAHLEETTEAGKVVRGQFGSVGCELSPVCVRVCDLVCVTSVAWAVCLLGQGLLERQKVGASPLATVIRSRHSDGQAGHYPTPSP